MQTHPIKRNLLNARDHKQHMPCQRASEDDVDYDDDDDLNDHVTVT